MPQPFVACREPSWWPLPRATKTGAARSWPSTAARGTPTTEELLAQAQADVVAICTPHDLHAPMTLAAAQAGAHVLCEKPMARNVAECDAMIAACDRAGVTLGVAFQGRFEPLSVRLKDALDAGRLGRLLWASANTLWHRTDAYYRSGPWRGTWEHEGGGVLINQAIHAIDLLIWLTGMPETGHRPNAHAEPCHRGRGCRAGDPGIRRRPARADPGDDRSRHPGYPERLEFFGTTGQRRLPQGTGAPRVAPDRSGRRSHRRGRGQQRRGPAHGHHRGRATRRSTTILSPRSASGRAPRSTATRAGAASPWSKPSIDQPQSGSTCRGSSERRCAIARSGGGVGIGPGHELTRDEARRNRCAAQARRECCAKSRWPAPGYQRFESATWTWNSRSPGCQQALLDGRLLDVGVEGVEEQAQVVCAHPVDQRQPLRPPC